MSYAPSPAQMGTPQPGTYSSPPPAPPPKTSTSSAPYQQGPPLPPPPTEPQELDGSTSAQYRHQNPSQTTNPSIPPIEPNWLPPNLKDKTTTDLHALLQDPNLQTALLQNPTTTHPSIPSSQNTVEPLITSNLSLAQSLTHLEAQLTHLRAQTQSRLLALRALEQQHRAKLVETESALKAFSPMALYQKLSASASEQDAVVRASEESWLDEGGVVSERELNEFLRRVREGKKVAFLRRERKARWDEGRVGGWR